MNEPLDLKRFVQRKFRFTRASPPSITLRTMASRPFGVRGAFRTVVNAGGQLTARTIYDLVGGLGSAISVPVMVAIRVSTPSCSA
jgi:hypothetical protein